MQYLKFAQGCFQFVFISQIIIRC